LLVTKFPPRGPDKRPRKRMTPVSAPFSRALRRGAIDNRSREGRFLTAARHRLIQHLGGNPSTTQLVLVDRVAWLMLHCLLLDQRIASGADWGENDRKCYLAFSNSLVRSLREIGLEGSAAQEPSLAQVLKAERAA
jgi:hypothetical protein